MKRSEIDQLLIRQRRKAHGTILQIFYGLILASSLSACFTARFVPEGKHLFQENQFEFTDTLSRKQRKKMTQELSSISQLQPNKKVFGLTKTRLWFYYAASRRKQTRFKEWIRTKVGEAPVYFDSIYAQKSVRQMETYLSNHGYFYAKGNFESQFKAKQASVLYRFQLGKAYTLRQINFPQETDLISQLVRETAKDSHLKPTEMFSVDVLKKERERITELLRNRGYYAFNQEYIAFSIDSHQQSGTLDIRLIIQKPADGSEHALYFIDQIYLITDYTYEKGTQYVPKDTVKIQEYHVLGDEIRIRPSILVSAVHFRNNYLYRKTDQQRTISHISDLGIYKFINIKYDLKPDSIRNMMDVLVYLTPAKRQEISAGLEVNNNTDYLLGLAGTVGYRNRSIFRGAEAFEVNLKFGGESNLQRDTSVFSTIDFTADVSLLFNQFLAPSKLLRLSKNSRPKTRITIKNNYLNRVNSFTLNTTGITFGYDWKISTKHRHIFNPFSISFVRAPPNSISESFRQLLENSPTLRNSFSEQFIMGMDYTYIWTNQLDLKPNSWFFKFNGRVAGNLLYGISSIAPSNRNESRPYTILNTAFAQFVQVSSDIKHYHQFRSDQTFVSRFFGGVGLPYLNSSVLPYVQQFFSGGANGIRAWRVRTLGPGAFDYTQSKSQLENGFFVFDQTGDIRLEGNLEYRFPLYRFIKGGLFLDAGNIWILNEDSLRPKANFEWNRFYKEFAMGAGMGIRLDFTYFILRVDFALPLRDPSLPEDNRWISNTMFDRIRDRNERILKFNLALGLPF